MRFLPARMMSSVVAPAWCQCQASRVRPTLGPHSMQNSSISGIFQMNSLGNCLRMSRGPRNSRPRRRWRPRERGRLAEAFQISLAEFDFGDGTGRHDPRHHARATYGGGEDGGVAEFGHAGLESGLVLAKFYREVEAGGAEVEFGEEIFGGISAEFHGCVRSNVGAGEADFGGKAGEFRPGDASGDKNAV